jgi:hypothetical protein
MGRLASFAPASVNQLQFKRKVISAVELQNERLKQTARLMNAAGSSE